MEIALIWALTLIVVSLLISVPILIGVKMVEHRRIVEANSKVEIAHNEEVTKRIMVEQARNHDELLREQLDFEKRQLELTTGQKVDEVQEPFWSAIRKDIFDIPS